MKRQPFYTRKVYLSDLFKWLPKGIEVFDDFCEKVISFDCMDYMFEPSYRRDIEKEHLKEAVAIFRKELPGVDPAPYMEAIKDDLVRAVADASCHNYEVSFLKWLKESIEDWANATGLKWTWPEKYYGSDHLVFTCSRKDYLDKTKGWWPVYRGGTSSWNNYVSDRARADYVDEVMDEHFEDLPKLSLEDFDPHGYRYADPEDWRKMFLDYSEALSSARKDLREKQARLKEQIRHRAPLEKRV